MELPCHMTGCKLHTLISKKGCSLADPENDCNWPHEPTPKASGVPLNEIVRPLPSNTAELLLALHGEFYGKGLANADAFRILPNVVKQLRLHGEID